MLGGGELLDGRIVGVAVYHSLDDVVEVEFRQYILGINRNFCQIVPEVGLDVIWIGKQQVI